MADEFLYSGPQSGPLLMLAHGAGAGAGSDFMQTLAQGCADQGIRVLRFNFAYMRQCLREQRKRPPSPVPGLVQEYRAAVERVMQTHSGPLMIGGKSMGGRVASLLLQQDDCPAAVAGAVCLGYPFHPQGKPDALRTDHLHSLRKPLLVIQGERDAFGSHTEVAGYALDNTVEWLWLADGDHDFKPRQRSGFTQAQHLEQACARIAAFIRPLTA